MDEAPVPLDARKGVERWILLSMAWLRLAQYVSPLPVLVAHVVEVWPPRQAWLVGSAYLAGALWSTWLFWTSLRRRGHRVRSDLAVADVLVITVLQTTMPLALGTDQNSWTNWTFGPAIGASFVVILYGPGPWRWWVATFPILSWATIPIMGAVTNSDYDTGELFAWLIGIPLFAGLGAHIAAVLRALARNVDEARAAEAKAVEREVELRAILNERRRQARGIHDTALLTLEMIAGGNWNADETDIRHRCQQDAAYLRSLMSGDDVGSPGTLLSQLSEIVRDRSALGLRVHPQFRDLSSSQIPGPVIEAMAGAISESLNNVAKHADVREAWLTVVGTSEGGVHITILDRGVGFTADGPPARGMTRSIRHPMEHVGGTAAFDSEPGQGTTVELSWNP